MVVTAWNNGAHSRNGSGYGFRVKNADRNTYFKKDWTAITLEIEGEAGPVQVPINGEGFWSELGQPLACQALGRWMRKNGLAPWGRGNAPSFVLDLVEGTHFKVSKVHKGHAAF